MRSCRIFVLVLSACSTSPNEARVAPTWADEPSRAEQDGEVRRITGIGIAREVERDELASIMAAARARAEVSRIFEAFSGTLAEALVKHADASLDTRVDVLKQRFALSALPTVVIMSEGHHARAELDVSAWLSRLVDEPTLAPDEQAYLAEEGADLFASFVSSGGW